MMTSALRARRRAGAEELAHFDANELQALARDVSRSLLNSWPTARPGAGGGAGLLRLLSSWGGLVPERIERTRTHRSMGISSAPVARP